MTMAQEASFQLDDGRRLAVNMPSASALLDAVEQRLRGQRGFTVATLNLDHLVKLRRDAAFRDAYAATDFVVADGNPVIWLARLQGTRIGLAPGSDLTRPLCALAAKQDVPVAFYGATREALDKAAMRLERDIPGLRVVLKIAPPFGFDPLGPVAEADAACIGDSGARLCLVALGAPRQEIFATRAVAHAPECGFVSVGAGLDFVAGTQKRAPSLFRHLALEWVWRVLSDPRRLARRYAACFAALPRLAADSLAARHVQTGPR